MLRIAFQEAFDRLSCLLSSIHQLFFFHNFHVSLKFCSSACNKLFMVNVSNYHMFFLFFFGNAQCCALRLLILECNKWDDLLLIRMTEKTMHSRLEEVFIFGCSALLCHLGNFLFWAARGSVAPTLRCIPGNCGLPSLEKSLKKGISLEIEWDATPQPCSFRINPERVKKFLFLG